MYRYVAFDDIDKNKYNGTVHFSPNGNVYGYHWYLKSVWRAWDIVVEDDYESVLPILPGRVTKDQYKLLPDLGPYSVNALTPSRVNAMLDVAAKYSDSSLYPINRRVPQSSVNYDIAQQSTQYLIDTIDDYDSLMNSYQQDISKSIETLDTSTITMSAGVKPEVIVADSKIPDTLKNALLRIMYNAMHRGLGWSSAIIDKASGKYQSISFFVSSHNKVYEVYNTSQGSAAHRMLLLDLMLRNNAGKPNQIVSGWTPELLLNMGFEATSNDFVRLNPTLWGSIKNRLNL